MDTVNVLNQMAEYDFNSPINATIIFEENDNDIAISDSDKLNDENIVSKYFNKENSNKTKPFAILKRLKNRNRSKDAGSNKSTDVNIKNCKDKQQAIDENQTLKTVTTESNPVINIENDNISLNNNQNFDTFQYYQKEHISNDCSIITEIRKESEHSNNKLSEPFKKLLENLLVNLSEYLIIIMDSYNDMLKVNSNGKEIQELRHTRRNLFLSTKKHFFELSYSTMISVMIPQEKNTNFVNMFINYTVDIANKRPLKWKCTRNHVLYFYKDLVLWSKQKKATLNAVQKERASNENSSLKEHLNRAPISQPILNLTDGQNSNTTKRPLPPSYHSTVAPNTVCLFSSGSPGNEITINIAPETLLSYKDNQYTTSIEMSRNQNIQPQYSPPQAMNTISNNIIVRNSAYPSQSFHQNEQLAQQHQIYRQQLQDNQFMSQPVPNYQNPPVIPNAGFLNMYDNKNSHQMHETQIGQMTATFRPVISNGITLNPKPPVQQIGRCCICGKNTEIRCLKCNKPSFCSYLCQELGFQSHRANGCT